jgi:ribosome biogenesis GTPase
MNPFDFDDLYSLDDPETARLRRIGLTPGLLARSHELHHADSRLRRITEVQRDAVQLHDGDTETRARTLPALLAALEAEADALAVGDWVLAERNVFGEWWVHARVPPRNQLARRLHDGRDKVTRTVIVANVDTALLVMGLDHDFNPRRLERYLALVRLAGIETVVVLTKADGCSDTAPRLAAVRRLLPAGAAAVAVDARLPSVREQLGPWLGMGRTLVALGSSGTGKSTLTNTLVGHDVQATGAARADDGRGRHTTTSRCLHVTPDGACLIDTPGLRTLRLDGEAGAVAAAFDDIGALAGQCRFRDCRHQGEPGCAVRDAVAPERLRNFHKLRRETERDRLSALERRAQLQIWKVRARAARERARGKP